MAVGALLSRHARLVVGASWYLALEELVRILTPVRSVVTVRFDVTGGVVGTFVLLLDDGAARALHRQLAPRAPSLTNKPLSASALAALSELGNIAVSACLNSFARGIGVACVPSVPHLVQGPASEQLRTAFPDVKAISATPVDIDDARVWLCMSSLTP